MPMDGFTLSFMARELNEKLAGGRVDKVNQPERDALTLLIRSGGGNHRLLLSANANQARAQLTGQNYENPAEPPMFCMLMRKHLLGARVIRVEQLFGDRILEVRFDALDEMSDHVEKTLYLEVMGRYSDLTLVGQDGVIVDAIRHVNSEMSRVRTLLPGDEYQLPPRQEKLTPEEISAETLLERLSGLKMSLSKGLMESVSGMAGLCSKEVCAQIGVEPSAPLDELDLPFVCGRLADFFAGLGGRFAPVTLYDETGLAQDFFPFPYRSFPEENQKPMESLSRAMDEFYLGRDLRMRMQQKSAGLQRHIKSALERVEKKKSIMQETLRQSDQTEKNRIFGDLLTANLYLMEKGQKSVRVQNYYEEGMPEIEIPLDIRKTPNQNAQSYYKKYRKAKVAEQYAAEQMVQIEKDLLLLENALEDLENCQTTADMGEIRYLLSQNGFLRPDGNPRKQKKLQEGKPYRFVSPDGTVIEVGKNSIQNDRLTLHARGNETWLHAQGIPGSHVIVHTEQEPSDATLLYAAKLAAYFSKGRNHPALPVDYTLRKYVKKSANSPAGLVTYINFKTLLVGNTPEEQAAILKLCGGMGK